MADRYEHRLMTLEEFHSFVVTADPHKTTIVSHAPMKLTGHCNQNTWTWSVIVLVKSE